MPELTLTLDLGADLARSDARHGWGCFETCRVQDGAVRWLDLHLDRLRSGCRLLGLPDPPSLGRLEAFLADHLDLPPAGGLRLVAVDGRLGLILDPPPPPPRGPLRVDLATGLRRLSGSPGTRAKLLSYADNRLLHREAEARGLFEVIALNERGHLTDGGRTTLLLAKAGEVLTPAADDGALPGIARRVLLEGGWIREASLTPVDLAAADGLMLVNALRGGLEVRPDPGGLQEACAKALA